MKHQIHRLVNSFDPLAHVLMHLCSTKKKMQSFNRNLFIKEANSCCKQQTEQRNRKRLHLLVNRFVPSRKMLNK